MSILSWLNPVNWVKGAIAASIDNAIEENVTIAKCKSLLVDGVNLAVVASEQRWSDDQCRTFARGCRLAAKAMEDVAEAIDPDGADGRAVTADELELLIGDAQAAFGTLMTEDKAEEIRDWLKGIIHEKLGF